MFIELSGGLPINTDQISFIRENVSGKGTYVIVFSKGISRCCTEEDLNRIKALLLPGKNKQRHCNRSRNVVLSEFNCGDIEEFLEGLSHRG